MCIRDRATAAWTDTGNDAVKADEGSMNNITDGNKDSGAFGVFGAGHNTKSSYMQVEDVYKRQM